MTGRVGGEKRGRFRPVFWLVLASVFLVACDREVPADPAPPVTAEQPEMPERDITPTSPEASTPPAPGQGVAVLASGFEGLVPGLDGSLYEGYEAGAIRQTQDALRRRGLYRGPVNGVLDRPTMLAIYAFQSASLGLDRSGIPTPRTRRLLEQGAHTF